MSNAALDSNGRQTLTALLNTNGTTVTRVKIKASTHGLQVSEGSSGSDNGGTKAGTDDNDRTSMFAVSNADGISPIALYVNSSGQLLIKST